TFKHFFDCLVERDLLLAVFFDEVNLVPLLRLVVLHFERRVVAVDLLVARLGHLVRLARLKTLRQSFIDGFVLFFCALLDHRNRRLRQRLLHGFDVFLLLRVEEALKVFVGEEDDRLHAAIANTTSASAQIGFRFFMMISWSFSSLASSSLASRERYCVAFLCDRMLHVSAAPVMSIATLPSSMC